ncbi:lipid II:glycine glycyltransferase FemX [Methylobacter psychrophilus]|uniref:lipid II:glycine glycyltransferase FemX n=1 Tax=Methylobacter psychrophilus TaxID=96941 RepID=UPI0021D4E61A|nr:peptidoglycan bridge formation glycyltransferase FemA/FemB family protein [Methylobacter psychrophilus]
MKVLSGEYSSEFGHFDNEYWGNLMETFQDANIYQTHPYDTIRYGRSGVIHMILKQKETIVAAAQARVLRLPGTKIGIAYLRWGPMWRLKDNQDETEVFRQALRALRNEFSHRRGLVLQIYPLAYRDCDAELNIILQEEGYKYQDNSKTDRTLIRDLTPSLDELRVTLDQKWRNCLNRGERNGLELVSGEEESFFEEFEKIYEEMVNRKTLVELNDITHLKRVQKDLPEGHKLKIILARLDGKTCAGAIFSMIGKTGVYLVGATSDIGMKTNGSYLVQWEFMKWLKGNGFLYYDLNGINPQANPGTYKFKRGLAGKNGRDVEFLGKYQVADNRLGKFAINCGEKIIFGYRRLVRTKRYMQHALINNS